MVLYMIGHSNHPPVRFIELLFGHGSQYLADVRSTPYSRYHSQFSQAALQQISGQHKIAYVYLGKELEGRQADPG